MTSRLLVSLALGACLLPACGQDAPPAPGSLELRLAERYGVSAWPASAGPRLGLDPATVRAPGWVQLELTRDARRAEARVTLGPARLGAGPSVPQALLRVRRYETPAQARAALLGALAQVQATLSRRADVGDLAFGTAGGPLSYVIGTYGNLGFVLRTLHAKQKARGDLAPLVRGLDEALRATVPLDDGAQVPLPRVLGVEHPAAAGAVGSATPFQLRFDPAGASAVALAFDCSADASVLQTEEGFELYPARPGPVEVTVRFVTADLRAGSYRFTLEVPAGSTGR